MLKTLAIGEIDMYICLVKEVNPWDILQAKTPIEI